MLQIRDAATTKAEKALRKLLTKEYPLYSIYLVVSLLFALTLLNILSSLWVAFTVRSVRRRRNGIQREKQEKVSDLENMSSTSSRGISLRRIPLAILEAIRIATFRVVLPVFSVRYTMSEVFVGLGYLFVMLFFTFYRSRSSTSFVDPLFYANRAGVLAVSQLTFIVALAGKNNAISVLTGIGYEKLNILHRAASRTLLILSWVHLGGRVKIVLKGENTLNYFHMQAGVVATVAYTLVVIFGIRQIRNAHYEKFFVIHNVLIFIFLLFLYFHVRHYEDYISYSWPPFIPWAFDRVVRLARLLHLRYLCYKATGTQGQAKLEVISANTLRVKVRLAYTSVLPLRWRAGQSAYLSVPVASRFGFSLEAHPFTIATVDTPLCDSNGQKYVELMFIVRARQGFTQRLYDYTVQESGSCSVSAYIDGPYGEPPSLRGSPHAVLIAGGSGVSFTLPLLLDLSRLSRADNTICTRVLFIWYIRNLDCVDWISDVLSDFINNVPSGLSVDIRISITNTSDTSINVPTLESKMTGGKGNLDAEKSSSPTSETSSEELGSKSKSRSMDYVLESPIVSITKGRINLSEVVEEEVSVSSEATSICVSGPQSLIDSVRGTLREPSITSPIKILRGGANVALHVETFGM